MSPPRKARRRYAGVALILALIAGGLAVPGNPATAATLDLANPSFEDVAADGLPTSWNLDPNRATTASASTTRPRTGERSLRMDDPADNSLAVRSDPLVAESGEAYTATGWVSTEQGSPAWLYLEFWNASGGRISETHAMPTAAEGWTRVETSAVAPAGAKTLTVLIYGSGSAAGISYYDDISVDGPDVAPYDPAIGTAAQLFVDDYRIDATETVSRVTHPAVKSPPLLRPDKPWESNNAYLYGTVLQDPEKHGYMMWYHVYDRATAQYFTCYATSTDGVHWTKPNLGVVPYNGSAATNIVGTMHSPTVIRDDADPDQARRYKMFAMVYDSGYSVYFSPDGIHWTPSPKNPVLPDGDVANVTYDHAGRRFVATSKHPDPSGRAVFVSYSTDFETWTTPKLILTGDDRDQAYAVANGFLNAQIYGMPVVPYNDVYLGFPWLFQYGGAGAPGTAGDGPIDTQLAVSRDLEHWQRPDRTPVIPRGVEGSFDSGMIFTAGNVIVADRRVMMYYGGWDGLHGSATRGASIGLATWRLDGFVSYANGGDRPGTVTTKPITFTGKDLHVNAALRPGGSLTVEVLDAAGKPIAGYGTGDAVPVHGDRIDAVVRWTDSNLADLAGQQVRLRFHLDDGDLYSYRIS